MIRELVFAWRCHLCEVLITWALKVAPKTYVPSCVQAVVNVEFGWRRQAGNNT